MSQDSKISPLTHNNDLRTPNSLYLLAKLVGVWKLTARSSGPETLNVRMVDSATDEALFFKKSFAPWTFVPQKANIPLDKWKGKTVHLELFDENAADRVGWIEITDVTNSPK